MKKLWFVFLLLLFPLATLAEEEKDSLALLGWPRDAFTMEPVIDSTWVELMTLDSTVIATCKPEWNKQFRPNSNFGFMVPFRKGEYLVRVTNPKYQTAIKRFKIQVRKLDVSY